MLFVIYINDMPEVVDKDSHVFLFADDTKVFRQIKKMKIMSHNYKNDIEKWWTVCQLAAKIPSR